MAVSKVVYGGNTLVDLTNDTVTADTLVVGRTAHGKSGEVLNGTNPYEKTATDTVVSEQATLIQQIQEALEGKADGDVSYDFYEGGTSITPNFTTQTLDTANKVVPSDITVNPIPYSQYTGSTNITPSTTEQIIGTSSKIINDDITIEAIRLQSKSVTPTTSIQSVIPDANMNGLSEVTVGAIQTETQTVTPTESAQTITPTSGKYLSSVTVNQINATTKTVTPTAIQTTHRPHEGQYYSQFTVVGEPNLVSNNIISGKSIFGVQGNVVVQSYYTGTGDPSSSLGVNGDIYFKE